MPIAPGTSTAPNAAISPNILNLRQLLGDCGLARRLQANRCPFAFKDRAVSSIASDVNSTSSFAQSASQPRPSAVPTPQQTVSRPFTALLDAVSSPQQTGAQANPSPTPASGSQRQSSTFQSNNNSKSSTTATDASNTAPVQTSQGQKSQPPANPNTTAPPPSNNSKPSAQDSTTANAQNPPNPNTAPQPGAANPNALAQAAGPGQVQASAPADNSAKQSSGDKKSQDEKS